MQTLVGRIFAKAELSNVNSYTFTHHNENISQLNEKEPEGNLFYTFTTVALNGATDEIQSKDAFDVTNWIDPISNE